MKFKEMIKKVQMIMINKVKTKIHSQYLSNQTQKIHAWDALI
jgi:hypothetical protein